MSEVIIKDIYAETVFEWFHDSITEACGDGAGVICCKNFEEVSERFIEWWKKKYERKEFRHPKDYYTTKENESIINYHDSNENFMFCNERLSLGFHGDISFIVEENCKSAFSDFAIEALE